jgi:hypothetical protein
MLHVICGSYTFMRFNFRDHHFDTQERKRLVGRQKGGTILKDRNSLQKGSLGVRYESARCNQAKILPTVKMGI